MVFIFRLLRQRCLRKDPAMDVLSTKSVDHDCFPCSLNLLNFFAVPQTCSAFIKIAESHLGEFVPEVTKEQIAKWSPHLEKSRHAKDSDNNILDF